MAFTLIPHCDEDQMSLAFAQQSFVLPVAFLDLWLSPSSRHRRRQDVHSDGGGAEPVGRVRVPSGGCQPDWDWRTQQTFREEKN